MNHYRLFPQWAALFLPFFLALPASGEVFKIVNRTSDISNPNDPVVLAFNLAADTIEKTINGGFLSQSSRQNFADGMGKAGTSVLSAFNVDRASEGPRDWVFGVGVTASAYSDGGNTNIKFDNSQNNTLPDVGFDGQISLMAGTYASRFGWFDKDDSLLDGDRLMVYANLFYFSQTISSVHAKFFNVGLNAKYDIFEADPGSVWLAWGGINAASGLNFSNNTITYSSTLTESYTTTIPSPGSGSATVSTNLAYDLGVKSSTFTIPFELSSTIRFAYLFNLYGGGAVDLNLGSAGLTGSASGPVTATDTVGSDPKPFSGTAQLNLDDGTSGKPNLIALRAFLGLQINVSYLKLLLQTTVMSNHTANVAFLLRVVI